MELPKEGFNYTLKVNDKLVRDGNRLLYLAISGSHAWGLQREDSDIDLRGIYQKPTEKILSLHKGSDTIEYIQEEAKNLPKLDVQLYEVEKFFHMLCKHNGNMVTLLHSPLLLLSDSTITWATLGKLFLTRKLRYYYRGYAASQRKRALSQRGGKALIYTYREMFSGLYLMKHGEICFNFQDLWREAAHNEWYTGSLLNKYYENPDLPISDDGWTKFYEEWEELSRKLDTEAEDSPLPKDFNGYNTCNEYLLDLRLRGLRK